MRKNPYEHDPRFNQRSGENTAQTAIRIWKGDEKIRKEFGNVAEFCGFLTEYHKRQKQ